MRSPRTRSIRLKVAALLLVPLLTLIAIWGYAADVTGRDALAQRRYHTLDRKFAPSGQGVLIELGKERLASAMFLSTPRAAAPAPSDELRAQRTRVDAAVAFFRRESTSGTARGATNAEMKRRVSDVLTQLGALGQIRAAVDARVIDRLTAIKAFGSMVDAMHRLYDSLVVIDDSELYDWTLSTRAAGRALELMQRENALVAGALVTKGRWTAAEQRMFVEMLGEQRWQWTKQRSLLDPKVYNSGTAQIFASEQYQDFKAMEDRIADQTRGAIPVQAAEWQSTAQPLVLSINKMVLANSQRAGEHADDLGREAYIRLGVVGGAGLLAILFSILLSLRFGRALVRELVGLRGSAEDLAERRLPDIVERLKRDEPVDADETAPALRTGRTTEVVKVAEAFSKVQRTAIDAAVGQARLRSGVGRIFLDIARRNQSLLHRQLAMLDGLEARAEADDLEDLFRLDHLTTRMRRHAESLIILSGATPGRGWRRPVRVVDVLRGAVAEVEDYTRATVLTESEDGLVGAAVTDVIHLLAELVENAASFSPPNTEVRVMAERVGSGFVVEVEDRGLGLRPEALADINRRLTQPPEFDLVDTDQLGLFVVARLAARHGIDVSLRRSPYGGTTAIVLLPHELVVAADQMDQEPPPGAAVEESAAGTAVEAGTAEDGQAVVRTPALVPEPRLEGVVPLREGSGGRFAMRSGGGTNARDRTPGPPQPPETPPERPTAPSAPQAQAAPQAAPAQAGFVAESPPAPEFAPPASPWGVPGKGSAEPHTEGSGAPPPQNGIAGTGHRPPGNPWFDDPPDTAGENGNGAAPGEIPGAGSGTGSPPAPPVWGDDPPAKAGGGASGGPVEQRSAGTYAGLPRRVRQENLAPQLRDDPPPVTPGGGGPAGGIARSPEEARSMMASIQQGWRRGRAPDLGDEETR